MTCPLNYRATAKAAVLAISLRQTDQLSVANVTTAQVAGPETPSDSTLVSAMTMVGSGGRRTEASADRVTD
jgi:hypothetical protein